MSRVPLLAALAAMLLAVPAASAQEVIKTAPVGGPPAATPAEPMPDGPEQSPEAIGAWGRRVLAGEPAAREQVAAGPADGRAPGCPPPPDRKPHGEVWAGAGTGGYRDVGGVVTQPLGNCGSVTVMIDQSQSNYRWRGR